MWNLFRLLLITVATTTTTANASTLAFAPFELVTENHGTQPAEIAWLEVPQRHADPTGAKLRLRIVRLVAPAASRQNAPIVYFAGGPGGSGVGTARGPRWPVFDQMRQHGDVLLLDQRGTGESTAPPACPHQAELSLGHDALLASQQANAKKCIAFWRAQRVDLGAYSTVESAHDVDALRQALAVPKLRLWGMSYGTHLASSVLRLHGTKIERAILMGYEGPDDTLKLPLSADKMLQQIDALAARDEELDPAFRPLQSNIAQLLAQLQRQPLQAQLLRSNDSVRIGSFEAQLAIVTMLSRSETLRHLPLAVGLALRGEGGLLGEYVHFNQQSARRVVAMSLAMDVASGASPERLAVITAQTAQSVLGKALNFPFPDIANDLGIPDLGADFRAPLLSAVPTLFVVGTLDVRTPPANMEAALAGFANASQLIIDGAAHDNDLWLPHPEIATTLTTFMAGTWQGEKRLQAPTIDFATSLNGELWRELVGAFGLPSLLLMLSAAIALPVALLWWWWRRRTRRRLARVG